MTLDKVHVKEHFGDTKVNEPGSLPSIQTPLGETLLQRNRFRTAASHAFLPLRAPPPSVQMNPEPTEHLGHVVNSAFPGGCGVWIDHCQAPAGSPRPPSLRHIQPLGTWPQVAALPEFCLVTSVLPCFPWSRSRAASCLRLISQEPEHWTLG